MTTTHSLGRGHDLSPAADLAAVADEPSQFVLSAEADNVAPPAASRAAAEAVLADSAAGASAQSVATASTASSQVAAALPHAAFAPTAVASAALPAGPTAAPGTVPVATPLIMIADAVVGEGDGTATIVVSLSAPGTNTVSVQYATDPGTASTSDYASASGTLTFAPGETTKEISVILSSDATVEALDFFRVNLSAATNASIIKSSALVSIVDNDTQLPVGELPRLYVGDVVVDEKAGTADFVVLLGGPGGVANTGTVTVDYAAAGGTATSGSDFAATSGTLTFGPGETVKIVSIALSDDTAAEGMERFGLNLSNAGGAVIVGGKATAFIGANDATGTAVPTISVSDQVVGEGDGYVDVVISLSAPGMSNVSVAYATQETTNAYNGYDFQPVSGTLTFTPGETTKTVRVQLEGSGSYDSGALEHFRLNLSSPTNATLAKSTGMISIVDNDAALAVGEQPALFVRDVVVDEKAGTASFVVLLGGPGGVANTGTVTVDYSTANGAAGESDFAARSGTLTFGPGQSVKTVVVDIKNDTTVEGLESFSLNLSNASGAVILDGKAVAMIGANDGTASTAPTVSVADKVVGEGDGYVDVVVSLSAPSASNVSVGYATQEIGTAYDSYDFHAVSGTLNFAAGETTKTVRVHLEGSNSYDYGTLEHFRFNLSSPTNATLAKSSGMISIVDNDLGLAVGEQPGLFVRDVVVDEKAGTASFVVLLGGPLGVANASTVTVNYAVAGGNATSGSDYTGNADALSGTLTFAAGEVAKTVTVALTDDTTAEGAERLYLSLSNAVNANIVDGQGAATIGASDGTASTAPTVSVADRVVGEGEGWVDVTVSLSAPSASNVSVGYATQEVGTAYDGYDFHPGSGTLNFAAGETTKTVRIQLEGSGSYDYGTLEHFRFNLTSVTNATLAKSSGMISIIDNDTALAVGEQPALFVRDVVVDEKAGTASFVVLLGGPTGVASASTVTVNYAVAGGTATSGSDYSGNADALSGTLTFGAGEVTKTVTVALTDDTTAEGAERLYLSLSNAVNAIIVDGQGAATIGANDGPASTAPTASVADRVVGEGDGYVDVTVSLSAPSASNVSVGYATQEVGTAYDSYDFRPVGGTVNFAAGETTKTVRIQLEGSASYDYGTLEHFRFNLTSATNATLAKSSGMISIVDNDTALAVGEQPALFVRDVVVDEKAGTASFVVLLGGPTGVANASTVTVNYAVAGGTATSGSDYNGNADALSGTLTFGAGEVTKTVTVALIDDTAAESAERLNLVLSNAVNATIADANGVAVIGASDAAASSTPTISVANKTVSESDGFVDMVVTLSAPSTSNVAVGYTSQEAAPAYNGYDYQGVGGTLNFAAGETTKTVRIQLEGSSSYDSAGVAEAFFFNLVSPVNGTISTPSATITIIDDDVTTQEVASYGISDDVYSVDVATDVVVENAGGGTDSVLSSVTYTLGTEIENLTLIGSEALNGSGNGSNNVLVGNSAANTLNGYGGNDALDGKGGADTLVGGVGNDVYRIDNSGDVVTELTDQGTDRIESTISKTLVSNVENLTLTGSATINGKGTSASNVIIGNSANNTLTGLEGNDTLDGKAGVDTMVGGVGNDIYRVDVSGDVVTENSGEGTDRVESVISYTLGSNVENLTLTGSSAINGKGNSGANTLIGNTANNVLDGSTGADTMTGGLGNDVYRVDTSSDVVTEASGEGTDRVESTVSYVLGSNVENLTLTGSGATNGGGNSGANALIGNSANNTLDGSTGADTMTGGAGNDVYRIDNSGDVVTEVSDQGTDRIESSISKTLVSNVENLTLTGSAAINGKGTSASNVIIGNSANNTLTGLEGNDTLDGKAGVDAMVGGVGNDIYRVDVSGDVVTENSGEGTDRVESVISYTLGSNVENLTLTGSSAINGKGNSGANTLIGNTANNILDGSTGADTMTGGLGNDVYRVDTSSDVVTEASGEGTDRVESTVSYVLGSNVENLTLTGSGATNGGGNSGANALIGNSANNTLDGSTGADTMTGGAGNDVYRIDNSGDVVTEVSDQGTDRIESSISKTLVSNVENLTLTGSAAINGKGTSASNVLIGNSANNTLTGLEGNDTLDGKAGVDTMVGGVGNDIYRVDTTSDVVTENSGEGTDRVESVISYTLGSNVENLTLTGSAAINGTGNSGANTLVGNSANNVLDGLTGADTMTGGLGNDVYRVDTSSDVVTEISGEGTDRIESTISYTLGSNFENLYLKGSSAINATGNSVNNSLKGNSANNVLKGQDGNDRLDGGTGKDTLTGGAGTDKFVFDDAFSATSNVDGVTDFTAGSDTFVLGRVVFINLTVEDATLNADAFRAGAGATGAADSSDRIIYNTSTGELFYDADGSGGSASVLFAKLSTPVALTAANFYVEAAPD